MKQSIIFSTVLIIAYLGASKSISDGDDDELMKLVRDFLTLLNSNGNGQNDYKGKIGQLSPNGFKADLPVLKSRTSSNEVAIPCGRTKTTPSFDKRIMGGHTAIPHSWPWQVRLQRSEGPYMQNNFQDICGATIISPEHILTAAHCLWDSATNKKNKKSKYRVIAGDHDRSTDTDGPTQIVDVQSSTIHPNYTSTTSRNDIAILVLKNSFNFNENVSSCCLPEENPGNEKLCYATGWGDTEKGHSDLLKQVRLPLFSTRKCKQKFYGQMVGDEMICAGYEEGYKDTCQGDSGGPLVCINNGTWVLEGVTSWGIGCALPNKPGVYTKVVSYINWIKSAIKITII